MTGAGVLVCASCGHTWTAPPLRSCPMCGARDDDELDDDAPRLFDPPTPSRRRDYDAHPARRRRR